MDVQIDQFVAVTGASVETARSLLEACGGNVDLAVNMHMEGETTGGSTETVRKSYEDLHGVRAPIPQTSGVLIEEVSTAGRSLRSRRLPTTVFDPFQDYSKVVSQSDGNKKKNLADLFKPPFDLIFSGTFEELRMAGQANKRWLLINLQDSKQFASQVLNRDVWSHEGVKTLVSQHFLFWQIYRITDDGLRFKQLYRVNTFPYVAILDPRTGEKMVDWENVTANKFLLELTEFAHNNKFDEDDTTQRQGNDGVPEMSEEEQLQAAIRASLREAEPKHSSSCQHDCDSDEFVSLSSENEEDDGLVAVECDREKEGTCTTDGLSRLSESVCTDTNLSSNYTLSCHEPSCSRTELISEPPLEGKHKYLSRKRKSSCDNERVSPPLKKMVCRSIANTSDDLWTGRNEPAVSGGSNLSDTTLRPKKGSEGSHKKGKQKAASSAVSVEERLKSGELQKADVSQVVIRFPDGTRTQKAFLSNSPIEELFTYLSERDINSDEHEIITNFPRRELRDLDHFITFQEAELYPSVTVFVQE